MLSLDDAVPYLLSRQLIDPACIVDGSLTIQSAARRNGNLKIEGPQGAGLLIKQPIDPTEQGRETLSSEAAFYQFCQEEPAAAAMAQIAPHLVFHDVDRCLIGLRLLSEAVTLSSFLTGAQERHSSIEVAGALGLAMGIVHQTFSRADLANCPRLAWLSRRAPWVMTIHRPTPQFLASQSPANFELIRLLQTQNGCAPGLDRLHANWRVETVIHGDIRPSNVLVTKARGELPREVRIIDWEMVQLGEAAWDLAGALQGFARLWVESMPMTENLSIDERVAQASFPLDFVQRLSRSLWRGYQVASDGPRPEPDRLLDRAVKLSAVRMIQAAYEISDELTVLDPRSVIMLQLGANVLSHPEVARTQLFGIS
jgi:hypothetical protein